MKHNDVVTLRNPQKDEMRFDGRPLPFRVLEMRTPRVLVEEFPYHTPAPFEIIPTHIYLESDLKVVYSKFTDIEIPAFLQPPEWIDASWGNDATARSMRVLPADSPFELIVWVHPEKVEDRELPDCPRYAVVVYESVTGDELDSSDANTESECLSAIDAFMANITLLLNNKLNWR